jgi:hypothetical protein
MMQHPKEMMVAMQLMARMQQYQMMMATMQQNFKFNRPSSPMEDDDDDL